MVNEEGRKHEPMSVMDHSKMTFTDLAQQNPIPMETLQHLAAIQLSASFQQIDSDLLKHIPSWLFARRRKNQSALSQKEKDDFNNAISAAIKSGTYQSLCAIHSDMSHNMHHSMGHVGGLRFLSWHRKYLLVMENALRTFVPGVVIPYWDYSHDEIRGPTSSDLPSWVHAPEGVTRDPGSISSGALPTKSQLDGLLTIPDYTTFTEALESIHDAVHVWVGGNTMPYPPVSPNDPLFWLHHGQVDRIWALWQARHPPRTVSFKGHTFTTSIGINPPLTGNDAVLDPSQPMTVVDVLDTMMLSYYYG